MRWIDDVDLDNLKLTAQDIIIDDEEIKYTFKKLKGRKSKSPLPNLIN
jgi:hypothetical protein